MATARAELAERQADAAKAAGKPVRVWRLDVTYPEGSDAPDWEPANWIPTYDPEDRGFEWPRLRLYLSRSGAESRAKLLRGYGATVTVVGSEPVEWTA